MKILKISAVMIAAVLMLCGCDFFRSLVGKPTSEELKELKELRQLRIDAQARNHEKQDSAITVSGDKHTTLKPEIELGSISNKYHVILGSFKIEENAVSLKNFLKDEGFQPKEIKFKNGYHVISVYGTDIYQDAYSKMEEIMKYKFCPYDIWIYETSQNLHK